MPLDYRPDVVFTALAVSWVAITLLTVMVASLHVRLRRLDQQRPAAGAVGDRPYAGLLGRSLAELAGTDTRLLIVVSTGCHSCRRLLAELADPGWTIPTALVWTSGDPGGPLGPAVSALPDGPRIATALGVRVTPFALVAGSDGRVVRAGPLTSLEALAADLRPSRTERTLR